MHGLNDVIEIDQRVKSEKGEVDKNCIGGFTTKILYVNLVQ